jgi:two-component system response regulator (stage 0 sporulation protein A)
MNTLKAEVADDRIRRELRDFFGGQGRYALFAVADLDAPAWISELAGDGRPMRPEPAESAKRCGTSVEAKITNIFISVGIPAHIQGYQFLREGVRLAIETPEIVNSITKKLYPSIAERFCTSASKVERAIRHAIEVAWNRGKLENINTLFGVHVYAKNEKPANGEFIALIADKLLLERI